MHHETSAQAGRRQVMVVAGSGRSGTSLFTGLAGRLGAHIPQPEVSANRSNPRGFGEPRWLVDFHNDLLSTVDVTIEDGRPEAWDLTDAAAEDPRATEPLVAWLEDQLAEHPRIVVKDPRLGWFLRLHRAAAEEVGADLRVATMLRHPAEVMRSREAAYGTRMSHTTRVIGWLTMMLGTDLRTRDLPRATVRYDDLLADWQSAIRQADATTGMRLLDDVGEEQLAEAGTLVDASLRRAGTGWDGLDVPSRVVDLATRTYDAYGDLVGTTPEEQTATRTTLDDLRAELGAYYDECFDVARNRTGAFARSEKRRVARRVREQLARTTATTPAPSEGLGRRARRTFGRLHRSGS